MAAAQRRALQARGGAPGWEGGRASPSLLPALQLPQAPLSEACRVPPALRAEGCFGLLQSTEEVSARRRLPPYALCQGPPSGRCSCLCGHRASASAPSHPRFRFATFTHPLALYGQTAAALLCFLFLNTACDTEAFPLSPETGAGGLGSSLRPSVNQRVIPESQGDCSVSLTLPHPTPWLSGKESTSNAGAAGDTVRPLGHEDSPGGGNGNPLQYFCLENPMVRGA